MLPRPISVRNWKYAQRLWPDTCRLQLPLKDCCRLSSASIPCNKACNRRNRFERPTLDEGEKKTTTSNYPSIQIRKRCRSIDRNKQAPAMSRKHKYDVTSDWQYTERILKQNYGKGNREYGIILCSKIDRVFLDMVSVLLF